MERYTCLKLWHDHFHTFTKPRMLTPFSRYVIFTTNLTYRYHWQNCYPPMNFYYMHNFFLTYGRPSHIEYCSFKYQLYSIDISAIITSGFCHRICLIVCSQCRHEPTTVTGHTRDTHEAWQVLEQEWLKWDTFLECWYWKWTCMLHLLYSKSFAWIKKLKKVKFYTYM